jgi:hypothetical protein
MWHCPHCGAPQAETARCWVCRRSSTTCSTCRHFRASLATDVGYCSLDRRRQPLTGRELRACWTQAPASAQSPGAVRGAERSPTVREEPAQPRRGFVPLDVIELPRATAPAPTDAPIVVLGDATEVWETRTSLFGELDR